MRFLHTGDWHVGKMLKGRTRLAEPGGPDGGGVIRLPSRDGSEVAQVAVLPFVQEPRIVDACRLFDPEEQWYQAYADRVAQMIEALANWFRADTVNILMAHVFTDGALAGGGERALHLGQVYAVLPQRLPATAHYVALNHLPRPHR